MVITYQTFLVRTPRHTILIDTCTGEDKGYPAPYDFPKQPWLDNFHAAGLRLEDVTHVLCTHLHFDHSGWNTMLRNGRWTPTFPNAKYIFHKGEYAHWEAITARGEAPPGMLKGSQPGNSWSYNCRPIVEAGRALLVDDTFQLDDNFALVPTPGHSPCHCCVQIRSQGQEAIVIGDLMHHALQCREPDWSTIFDFDPIQAAQSRRRLLRQIADTGRIRPADPFPEPDDGPRLRRRRPLSLYVRAVVSPFSLREKVARGARRMRESFKRQERSREPSPLPLSLGERQIKNTRPCSPARSPRRAPKGHRQSTP